MRLIIILTSILLFSILLFSSCRDDKYFIKGTGPSVTNARNPGVFSGVRLSISANVEIFRDSVFRVELHGQQNILDVIETRVSGKDLNICLERGTSIRKHEPITIKVFMPYVGNLDISGSGDISCVNEFSSTELTTNVSGSGNITFRGLTSIWFSANISGSGSIRHTGSNVCNNARLTVSGSGNIYSEWLQVGTVEANISGSGDVYLFARNELNAKISGSGNIHYRGNPSIHSNISGSGRLIAIQ
ncbi:MAG: DUF2807 domain-containing protein [Bacteroidia bacterium]|nr:DUF2807 domain-containing protein [Bacteroidia bacterium]